MHRADPEMGRRVAAAIGKFEGSQRELARRIGVGSSVVSKWKGGQPPGTMMLRRLATELRVPVEVLLTGKETPDQRAVRRDDDERRALEAEVARLRKELARLYAVAGQLLPAPGASRPSKGRP
jgi:transcriptional regulator with XRE-family HTH domain